MFTSVSACGGPFMRVNACVCREIDFYVESAWLSACQDANEMGLGVAFVVRVIGWVRLLLLPWLWKDWISRANPYTHALISGNNETVYRQIDVPRNFCNPVVHILVRLRNQSDILLLVELTGRVRVYRKLTQVSMWASAFAPKSIGITASASAVSEHFRSMISVRVSVCRCQHYIQYQSTDNTGTVFQPRLEYCVSLSTQNRILRLSFNPDLTQV